MAIFNSYVKLPEGKWPLILYRTSVPITKGSRRRRCNGDAPDPRGKRYICICGLWPESQRPVDWCLYHPIHLLQERLGCGECEADPLPKIDAHCAIPQQGWKHCWPFRHRTSFRLRGTGSSDHEGISGRAGHSSSRVEDWERFGSICIGLIFPRLGSQAAVMEGLCHQQPGGWKEFVDAKDRSCHGRWRGFVGGALSHHRRCPQMLRPWAVWAPRNPKLPQAMGAGTAASCTWKAGGVRSFDPSWGSCCLAIHQIAWSSKTPGLLGPPRQWLLPNPLTSRSAFFEPPWFQPIPSTQLRGYNRYRIYRYFWLFLCLYLWDMNKHTNK